MLRRLASQTAVYGISAILSKFLNYMLTPYLTRILTEEVYGEMSLYYAIIPFANVVLTMGLATGYFRFASEASSELERRGIFSTLWVAVSTLSVLFFVVIGLSSSGLNYGSQPWFMVVTAALIMVDNVAAIPLAALRQEGRAGYYTLVNVTGVVVNVIVCWALYTFIEGASSSPGWVLVANLVASLVSLAMLMPASIERFVRRAISLRLLRRIWIYSIPLMLAGIMGTAGDFIDRQMLNWMLPADVAKAEVGIYAAVAKIAALMVIFRSIYTLGAEPFFLQKFKKEDFLRVNAEALKYFVIVGVGIFLVITLFSDLFGLILDSSYRVGLTVVPLLLVANLLSGVLVNLSFWYKIVDKTRYAIYVTLVGVICIVVMNYWLIPSYGYSGSAWARVVSTGVMVVMSYCLNQRYYPVPYDLRRIGLYFALGAAVYALSVLTDTFDMGLRYCANILLILSFGIVAIKLEKIQWRKLKS